MKLLKNEPLKKHTTFRVGGKAKIIAVVENPDELKKILKENRLPLFILGGGSNVLAADKGFPGLIIKTTGLNSFSIKNNQVVAESGVLLSKLIAKCADAGLSGLEEFAGIPGTVGGAIYGNAGAFGNSIGNYVQSVVVLDKLGKEKVLSSKRLKFSYRKSSIKGLIAKVAFELKKEKKELIKQRIRKIIEERKRRQPWGEPSAGSVFKNPPGKYSAGELIEKAGLKGLKCGGAMVSKKHANFIVNLGGAKAQDILKLIKIIQKKVRLDLEIKVI